MNEWVSVKERLPERLTCVIGLLKDGCIYVVCQCDWDDVCNDWHFMPQTYENNSTSFEELTHWMHLPRAPKGEEK